MPPWRPPSPQPWPRRIRTPGSGHLDETADNYSLRPVVGTNRYYALGDRTDDGVKFKATLAKGAGTVRIGGEYLQGSWNMTQHFAAAPFAGKNMNLFRDDTRNRLGVFGEWEERLPPQWNMLLGLRSDTVWSSAGAVTNWVSQMCEEYADCFDPDA